MASVNPTSSFMNSGSSSSGGGVGSLPREIIFNPSQPASKQFTTINNNGTRITLEQSIAALVNKPSLSMAYYGMLSRNLLSFVTVPLMVLVSILSIVYVDISQLKTDISNNLRTDCSDLSSCLTITLILCVISLALTMVHHLFQWCLTSIRLFSFVFSLFSLSALAALLIENVIVSVRLAKHTASLCQALGQPDSSELYEVTLAANIIVWLLLMIPLLLLFGWYAMEQWSVFVKWEQQAEAENEEETKQEEMLLIQPIKPNTGITTLHQQTLARSLRY